MTTNICGMHIEYSEMNMTIGKLIEKLKKYPPNTPIALVGSSVDVAITIPPDGTEPSGFKCPKAIATFDGDGARQRSRWADPKVAAWKKYR